MFDHDHYNRLRCSFFCVSVEDKDYHLFSLYSLHIFANFLIKFFGGWGGGVRGFNAPTRSILGICLAVQRRMWNVMSVRLSWMTLILYMCKVMTFYFHFQSSQQNYTIRFISTAELSALYILTNSGMKPCKKNLFRNRHIYCETSLYERN